MHTSNEKKISTLSSFWDALSSSILNNSKELPSVDLDPKKEMLRFRVDLLSGMDALLRDLYKINSKAAVEFRQWLMENNPSLDQLFELDPLKLVNQQPQLLNFIKKSFPSKFFDYLFYAALNPLLEQDYYKAEYSSRLLTILFPLRSDYRILHGLSEREKKLPLFSLVSFTLAKALSPENPYPLFYLAESWMALKSWEPMKAELIDCLASIGSHPKYSRLKVKCEELLSNIPHFSDGTLPIPNFWPLDFPYPYTEMEKLVSKPNEEPEKEISPEEWTSFKKRAQEELNKLNQQINQTKELVPEKKDRLGFFENQTLIFSEKGAKISFENLMAAETLAAGFFLASLNVGINISSINSLAAEGELNLSLGAAAMLAYIFDKTDLSSPRGIPKHYLRFDPRREVIYDEVKINFSCGSDDIPYQEIREDSHVRACRFHPKDIIGKSILDFGCNEGSVLFACKKLGASSITGIDLDARAIERAKKFALENKIKNADFFVGDMENSAFLSTLPKVDTVFLLAILDTSQFVNKTAVIARVSQFAKSTLYYEGHANNSNHVPRMYELLISTNFTRFEFIGLLEKRPFIRCGREIYQESDIPQGGITSDASDAELLSASEIYLFTDSIKNPPFGTNCKLIQFVIRNPEGVGTL